MAQPRADRSRSTQRGAEIAERATGLDDLLSVMLGKLEPYLESDDLFLPVVLERGQRLQRHSLTLANLLERLDRLEASGARDRVAGLREDLESIAERHRDATARKLRKEMQSNLNLWQAFVRDLEAGDAEAGDFLVHRRHRSRFERLSRFAAGLDIAWADLRETVLKLDAQLQAQIDLRPSPPHGAGAPDRRADPPKDYWWMYVTPAEA